MVRPAIHQFLPSFAGARDAIGRHTIEAQRLLREAGFDSDIYAGEAVRAGAGLARQYQTYKGSPSGPQRTWLLYQCSTGSPVGTFCAERPEPMILDYHNITPAELFEPWEPHVGVELVAGRHQLADLAPATVLGLADSSYNEAELIELGYQRTAVVPILIDLADFEGEPDPAALGRLQAAKAAGGADWLFVGRIAPNKAQHDVVKAFAAHRRLYGRGGRLHLVGGSSSHRYETALRDLIAVLGLERDVTITGSIGHEELIAHYRTADVFVCLSDHEGFCVPLLEAMHGRVPIVALASTAVPETLGEGGLLVPEKRPASVAAVVDKVLSDPALADAMRAGGQRRLADFSLSVTGPTFLKAIESLTGGAA